MNLLATTATIATTAATAGDLATAGELVTLLVQALGGLALVAVTWLCQYIRSDLARKALHAAAEASVLWVEEEVRAGRLAAKGADKLAIAINRLSSDPTAKAVGVSVLKRVLEHAVARLPQVGATAKPNGGTTP